MKIKYILENYDRIIFEIKNPKIIFSNDLIPYLKNFTSDSYLIHQVDFNIQNTEVKYSVNQPIHNLHPSASQIKTKDFLLKPELDHYFTKIIKELNIESNQTSWHWCENNKNRAYIFQDFEIENLTQEQRFFLYCYHTVKKENFIIKKINKETVFKLNSKTKIEQYINQKQCALQNLTNGLLMEINPEHPSELNQFSTNYDQKDCFKITYIYLEKLYNFIENEYKTYLNLNNQIPLCSKFIKDFKISKKLNKVKTILLKSDINAPLLKVLEEPLSKIEKLNTYENLTYFEFNFCSDIINELHKQIESDILTEVAIVDCFFDLI